MDGSEITSFNLMQKKENSLNLNSPDENYFANTPPTKSSPTNTSPANVYRSDDCNELLAKELAKLDDNSDPEDG